LPAATGGQMKPVLVLMTAVKKDSRIGTARTMAKVLPNDPPTEAAQAYCRKIFPNHTDHQVTIGEMSPKNARLIAATLWTRADDPPEEKEDKCSEDVLCLRESGVVGIGFYTYEIDEWIFNYNRAGDDPVVYWMPILPVLRDA